MKKANHTRGKWSIGPRINKYKSNNDSKREMELLKLHGKDEFEAMSIGTSKGQIAIIPLDEFPYNARANAKLIAAAPDLLQGMIDIGNYLDQIGKGNPTIQAIVDRCISNATT